MLHLLLGASGGGKTTRVVREVGERASRGDRSVIIVPEQYSHEAERLLCRECGPAVCLHAEVLSFSRLCTRVFTECGGGGKRVLDAGGQLLVMSRAVSEIAGSLKTIRTAMRADVLKSLVDACSELRCARLAPERLLAAAGEDDGPLSGKLRDMALIMEAYAAMIPADACDPSDRLETLIEKLGESSFGEKQAVYIDGFSDFTAQELAIIEKLLQKGAETTVCLGCENLSDERTENALPRRTAERLVRMASDLRAPCDVQYAAGQERSKTPELAFLDESLFSWERARYEGEGGAVSLYEAQSVFEECELAAAEVLRFVRGGGRWRDVAVAARGWETYAGTAESVFEKFGVPVQVSVKSDILQKPVMELPIAALDAVNSGWEAESVLRCLKTELFGEERAARDLLENYVFTWGLRGSGSWRRGDWTMNPAGYSESLSERSQADLARINGVRALIADKLGAFEDAMKAAKTARGKCRALYDFLCSVSLAERLEAKTESLRQQGRLRLAEEYESLWDILIGALEQYAAVLGETEQTNEEFTAQLRLLLSQYEIGTIPVALDRVGLGDMARSRRRGLKMLVVLGASDDRLPSHASPAGLFSESEREELKRRGINLGGDTEDGYEREMNVIAASLRLPSERLVMTWSSDGGGQPSYILKRIAELLSLPVGAVTPLIMTEAEKPCLELAVREGAAAGAAYEHFAAYPESRAHIDAVRASAKTVRGRLARLTAESLYGKKLGVTASRAEKFRSCRFAYFMQYGLNAKPRRKAALDAMTAGSFMHYVLENVCREVGRGGFASVTDEALRAMTARYVAAYAESALGGLADKSGRFRYLYARLGRDAEEIVLDMAGEMRVSSFEPYDFELDFSAHGDMPPAAVTDGDVEVRVRGKVDRVDGWVKDGRLYLRVVDYKTGRRAFSLSDVWYGMGMQMLIYLFVLQKYGRERYGMETAPAGVLYAPARDVLLSAERGETPEDLRREREKKLVRSGLLLRDPEVIEAMEHGTTHRYLPVKISKDGAPAGDSLASAEQLGVLAKHVDAVLLEMGRELRRGDVAADPFYRNDSDNACLYCDFCEACRFGEAAEDRTRYLRKLKPGDVWLKMREEKTDG